MLLSIVLFLVGCFPPIAAKIIDPFIAYLIWPITFPAWFLSALFGVILGVKCKTETLYNHKVSTFGWCMLLVNIVGFILIWFIPFYET